MVRFKVGEQEIETLDEVRYRAVLRHIEALGPEAGQWPWIRAIGSGTEIDAPALLEELDRLSRRGVPTDLAQMLGNIWNDVARTLRSQGKLGPAE